MMMLRTVGVPLLSISLCTHLVQRQTEKADRDKNKQTDKQTEKQDNKQTDKQQYKTDNIRHAFQRDGLEGISPWGQCASCTRTLG